MKGRQCGQRVVNRLLAISRHGLAKSITEFRDTPSALPHVKAVFFIDWVARNSTLRKLPKTLRSLAKADDPRS